MGVREDQERVVYRMPKRVAVQGLVCCAVIGLVGVAVIWLAVEFWMRIAQFSTKVARGTLGAGILITVVGGAGMLWCCWRLLMPRNVLVLDAQGLTGLYFGWLRWEEIRRLYVCEQHVGPLRASYLAIEPQDLEAVIARLNPMRRRTVRNQLDQDVPALLIGLWLLPVAVDELWLAIERFCPRVSRRQHGEGNRQQLG